MKISKQGVNVLTNTDPNNEILNTDYNTFKILESGTTSFTGTAGGYSDVSLNHGIGSASSFYVFYKFPDGYVTGGASSLPLRSMTNSGQDVSHAYASGSAINFRIYNGGASNITVNVAYYIFEAPL